jgi:hypothetical protein
MDFAAEEMLGWFMIRSKRGWVGGWLALSLAGAAALDWRVLPMEFPSGAATGQNL